MDKPALIINKKKLNKNANLMKKLRDVLEIKELPAYDMFESEKISCTILYKDGPLEKRDQEVIDYFNKYRSKFDFEKIVPIHGANYHSSSFVPNYNIPIQVNLIKPNDESKDFLYDSNGVTSRRIDGNLLAATRRNNELLYDIRKLSNRNGTRDLRSKSTFMKAHFNENQPYSVLKTNKGNRYEMQKELHKYAELKNQVYGQNMDIQNIDDGSIWD